MALKDLESAFRSGDIAKPDYIDRMHETHRHLFEYAEFMKQTDIAKIEITDGLVVMTTRADGIRLLADGSDKRIIPIEILNFSHYERDLLDTMKELINDGDTILDIGGNIGWYSINLGKRFPNAKIEAFEPIPKTYNYLKRNLELNGSTNVQPNNFGFSNEEKELTFFYYPEGSGNASLANLSRREDVEKIVCQVTRLDDYLEKRQLAPSFIKVDVEGAELFVFQGGVEAIRRHKPVIFSELLRKWAARFDYHPNDVIELLAGVGYRCFTATEGKLEEFFSMTEETVETNFFFLHAEKHAEKIAALTSR